MRSKNIFWGVILVTIGILFILRNMGIIYFGWYSILNLWPMFLIVLGISMLPIKGIVRILLAFVVIIGSIVFISNTSYNDRYYHFEPHRWFWNDDDYTWQDEEDNYEWRDQLLYEDYNDEIDNAVLELDAIAGNFTIGETTDYLLKFEREGNFGKYYLRADNAGSAVILKVDMDSYIETGPKMKNDAEISLHPDPVWDMQVDAGAARLDFDLTEFKIDRLEIDGGASSIRIRLGDRLENTDLLIDSGAVSVTIEVPESSGCEVLTNTVLSSKNLEGFEKIDSGEYRTAGYEDASHKIAISIDAAVSSLTVVRY